MNAKQRKVSLKHRKKNQRFRERRREATQSGTPRPAARRAGA
jgi:hypothetical protein